MSWRRGHLHDRRRTSPSAARRRCLHAARRPHAWKSTGGDTGRVLFLYAPGGPGNGERLQLAARSRFQEPAPPSPAGDREISPDSDLAPGPRIRSSSPNDWRRASKKLSPPSTAQYRRLVGAAKIAYGRCSASPIARKGERDAPRRTGRIPQTGRTAAAEAGGRNRADGARRFDDYVLVEDDALAKGGGRWPTAVRRARRSAPIMSAACCAAGAVLAARAEHEAGRIAADDTARRRGRRHPAGGPDAGGARPQGRHRRRVPPRLLAHGFPLPDRRRRQDRAAAEHRVQERGRHGRILARPRTG